MKFCHRPTKPFLCRPDYSCQLFAAIESQLTKDEILATYSYMAQ